MRRIKRIDMEHYHFFFVVFFLSGIAGSSPEMAALLELKAALDPAGEVLASWTAVGNPCGGEFVGVSCDGSGRVVRLSLQGVGLAGTVSPALAQLAGLSGVYLHYNSLTGPIPPELGGMTELAELYLNANRLSGSIPPELGAMASLQVLLLGYNQLTGGIPTQLGQLPALSVLSLQSNRLSGAIPASLGEVTALTRLDLSNNKLFGPIPVKLAQLPALAALDVSSNSLSGSVPSGLVRMKQRFRYSNNSGLCAGGEFPGLRVCTPADDRPEPLSAGVPRDIDRHCRSSHCSGNPVSSAELAALIAVTIVLLGAIVAGAIGLWQYRRSKMTAAGCIRSTEVDRDSCRRSVCSLVSVEYSTGWDPDGAGGLEQEDIPGIVKFNLEEVESATRYFSPGNLLAYKRKGDSIATYRGSLRDGRPVAVKRLSKTCCRQEEVEFLKGLKLVAGLRHDNVVALRGFCFSRGRGECFLVYDFVSGGSLSEFLVDAGDADRSAECRVLRWPERVRIVKGIAQGIEYLHKTAVVHQNLSAEKVLIESGGGGGSKPRIAGAGIHSLLADDTVFSNLKSSAAMGYLAPEYTTTGRFTYKSDIYAFGILMLQIISGKRRLQHLQPGLESGKLENLIDERLGGEYCVSQAARMASIALACTAEAPAQRPAMAVLVPELSSIM